MKAIAITGSIATGKSTVSKYLIQQGYPVIDTDIISRIVVEKGTVGLERLKENFGEDIIQADGTLNRKALSNIVFNDAASKEKLNQILHPLISKESKKRMKAYKEEGHSLIFVDIPLYYEVDIDIPTDAVWLVYVSPDIQLERLMKRNLLGEEDARQLISNQISIEDKAKWSEIVIDNSNTPEETYKQIDQLLKAENNK
ncbi:dephospho-CoA kinase [Aerococcaceae bacterium INB8]|uniref:Dephospho-CoA kinase n=1 Tax=Ruoffia halotolerans TaxID=2748684 RepID=A0A839A3H6_9LACT|nr:dephospho-CoA kinase [Ruoffia halotolerans]MBA5728461.1 dephospho-CoA kinase [Ruoffia halotolerans]